MGQKTGGGAPKRSSDKARGNGEMLNGFNRRTGLRNRRYKCDSEYHLAPKCSWRHVPQSAIGAASPTDSKTRRPFYSTNCTDAPLSARKADRSENGCEQSFSTAMDIGG